jgi:hypothetical protein
VLNASGLRKYEKFEFFGKCSFLGVFLGLKGFFFRESLRNQQILIFSHIHNLFPITFFNI